MSEGTERQALHAAERALLHASKLLQGEYDKDRFRATVQMVNDALAEVSSVLDEGRDEANEQVAT